jgi:hypothetical protein
MRVYVRADLAKEKMVGALEAKKQRLADLM